jgi:hypothetical protein
MSKHTWRDTWFTDGIYCGKCHIHILYSAPTFTAVKESPCVVLDKPDEAWKEKLTPIKPEWATTGSNFQYAVHMTNVIQAKINQIIDELKRREIDEQ